MTIDETRALLAGYEAHCDPACPGWIISDSDSRGLEVERCDECAHLNDVEILLADEDCEQLPEAQAALAAARKEEEDEGGSCDL